MVLKLVKFDFPYNYRRSSAQSKYVIALLVFLFSSLFPGSPEAYVDDAFILKETSVQKTPEESDNQRIYWKDRVTKSNFWTQYVWSDDKLRLAELPDYAQGLILIGISLLFITLCQLVRIAKQKRLQNANKKESGSGAYKKSYRIGAPGNRKNYNDLEPVNKQPHDYSAKKDYLPGTEPIIDLSYIPKRRTSK